MLSEGKVWGEERLGVRTDASSLLWLKHITAEDLLFSARNLV